MASCSVDASLLCFWPSMCSLISFSTALTLSCRLLTAGDTGCMVHGRKQKFKFKLKWDHQFLQVTHTIRREMNEKQDRNHRVGGKRNKELDTRKATAKYKSSAHTRNVQQTDKFHCINCVQNTCYPNLPWPLETKTFRASNTLNER